MASLLPRDHERMQGLHPHLVRVVIEARKAAPFIVLEGLRGNTACRSSGVVIGRAFRMGRISNWIG